MRRADIERQTKRLQFLRKVYNILDILGEFNFDYEGTIQKHGDTVSIRRLGGYTRNLAVVHVVPWVNEDEDIALRYVLDNVSFSKGGDFVLAFVDGKLLMGYNCDL